MRVAIDCTSALTQRAGVGRYTRNLIQALAACDLESDELLLWAASDSPNGDRLMAALPSAAVIRYRPLPVPERWLTIGWQRLRVPLPLERFIGPVSVAHAPDFVGPPTRAPRIATVHDLSYLITPEFAYPNLRRYLTAAVPRTLHAAHRVIAVSETTAADLATYYRLDLSRIEVIYHGVDQRFRGEVTEDEIERTITRLGVDRPYFVIVGTIEPRKNHLNLIAAVEQFRSYRREATLVIAGRPGWLSEPIMREIQRASAQGAVRYLSSVADDELPALYAGSLALVYPSWYEGFGLPLIEAMACATAVITSDRGALREIADGAALLVPPDAPDAIADAMRRVYDEPDTRDLLIRGGLERVEGFTWEAAAAAHLRLYREVARQG